MAKGQRAHFNKQTMGHPKTTKNGKKFTLLNPHEKGCKAAVELRTGRNVYTGEILNERQRAYRSGYLAAQNDSARCYNAKNKKNANGFTYFDVKGV